LPFGVEGLVEEVVAKSVKRFTTLLSGDVLDDLRLRAEAAVLRTVKPHLYNNPQCRNHDVCVLSRQIDPWTLPLTSAVL
jgi:hypothetical protein